VALARLESRMFASYDAWLNSGNPLDEENTCHDNDCPTDDLCLYCELCPKHCRCDVEATKADMMYADWKGGE
jgi:hypothetical protein